MCVCVCVCVCVFESVVRGHKQDMLFKLCGSKENLLMFISWLCLFQAQPQWHWIFGLAFYPGQRSDHTHKWWLLGSVVAFVDNSCCNAIDCDVSMMFLRLCNVSFKERSHLSLLLYYCSLTPKVHFFWHVCLKLFSYRPSSTRMLECLFICILWLEYIKEKTFLELTCFSS